MFLYHYFEKERGPFLSLSDLTDEEAYKIHNDLEEDNNAFARRNSDGRYIYWRRMCEETLRSLFIEKGGKPIRKTPHYMTLGENHYCKTWYECGDYIKIPIDAFDINTVSFTYGDSFPTIDPTHGQTEEFRRTVYKYDEILRIINKYGWPGAKWDDENTPYWTPMYVEAQAWSDTPIDKYRQLYSRFT